LQSQGCKKYDVEISNTDGNAIKDYQMLGFALDGGDTDDSQFVACAHKYSTKANEHAMDGTCYWTPNTKKDKPNPKEVKLFKNLDSFAAKEKKKTNALSGFSVKIFDKKIIAGAPGLQGGNGRKFIRVHPRNFCL
jgi:hypothetical protein